MDTGNKQIYVILRERNNNLLSRHSNMKFTNTINPIHKTITETKYILASNT